MKRILLIADAVGWIFDRHCHEIKNRIKDFEFDIVYTWHSNPATYNYSKYNLIYQLDPMAIPSLNPPRNKTLLGLRNEFMYDHSNAGIANFYLREIVPKCCMWHVVNQNQKKHFSNITGIPLFLVQHGVDTDCFKPLPNKTINVDKPLVIGTSGNQASDGEKGFNLVEEACRITGCELKTAKQNLAQGHLSKEQMSHYYHELDLYCCMSKTEGLNNCIMEAGASSVPVISTNVGAAAEMIENGKNGLLIERSVEALVDKIKFFNENKQEIRVFGEKFYQTITSKWSWNIKINEYRDMFNKFFETHR